MTSVPINTYETEPNDNKELWRRRQRRQLFVTRQDYSNPLNTPHAGIELPGIEFLEKAQKFRKIMRDAFSRV